MPIDGVSEITRIPRLGKIHLGVKVPAKGNKDVLYPKATDYFVCPQEVIEVYGPNPKELDIMFPVEEPELFAQQFLRAYSLSQGLVCIGTGVEARRKVDIDTGAMADHSTKKWEWRETICNPQECPEYEGKRCRRVMNLQFMMPTVPGIGVYQIDTSSFYSIVNINSMIKMLKGILGRCSLIPLTLALGPVTVSPPGIKQKTVYIMHIKKNVKIAELAKVAMMPPGRVLIPEADTEEAPDDLFPDSVIDDSKTGKPPKGRKPQVSGGAAGSETREPPKDEELFPEEKEEELPEVEPQLLQGWLIVKGSIKQLNVTDGQIRKWFAKAAPGLELGLADFDKAIPPQKEKLTNELLSKFESVLDAYRERQQQKAEATE
jgi:hypothetical protein